MATSRVRAGLHELKEILSSQSSMANKTVVHHCGYNYLQTIKHAGGLAAILCLEWGDTCT